jgi:hypothetical protein
MKGITPDVTHHKRIKEEEIMGAKGVTNIIAQKRMEVELSLPDTDEHRKLTRGKHLQRILGIWPKKMCNWKDL